MRLGLIVAQDGKRYIGEILERILPDLVPNPAFDGRMLLNVFNCREINVENRDHFNDSYYLESWRFKHEKLMEPRDMALWPIRILWLKDEEIKAYKACFVEENVK